MYPVLFEVGSFSVYGYGLMIALGVVAGVAYMAVEGKRVAMLTFDQANALFLLIFFAAVIGGKAFLFLEDPRGYLDNPSRILRGAGFVFYGSFIFAVPTMLWFFSRYRLDTMKMLDVMAITTCLVHIFGRIGCFLAGCCHGEPTENFLAVTFTDSRCLADPKGVPLHPTQLYEAGFITVVLLGLLWLRKRKTFDGQMFICYLMLYAVGRFIIEYYRGDVERGLLFDGLMSHSQLIAVVIFTVAAIAYLYFSRRGGELKESFAKNRQR